MVWAAVAAAAWPAWAGHAQPRAPAAAAPVDPGRPLADALRLDAGASCLERERLLAHVEMWLGGDHVERGLLVQVHGDAANRQKLWFEIERDGQRSRRNFDAAPDNCEDAHAVLGLAIALAIDEHLHETVVPEARAPRLKLLSLQPSFAYDVLPDVSLGLVLGGELGLLPWLSARADLIGHYSWSDQIAGSRGHFDSVLAGGSLHLCSGGWPDPTLRIAVCMGLASAALHARGTDYEPNASDTGLWLAVRSGLRFQVQLGIPWLVDLEVVSAVISPSFEAQRGAEALTRKPSSTGFMLSLGPGLSF